MSIQLPTVSGTTGDAAAVVLASPNGALASLPGPVSHVEQAALSAAGAGTAVLIVGDFAISLYGTATAVTAELERSHTDPAGTARWTKVDGGTLSGDASSGSVRAKRFSEPGAAWYRVNASAITGGNVTPVFTRASS
ncbi:hypothetical protein [Caulobacter segnis]|uniref:Uncharacterized protein n=1 Tax=Caulobacter segnis TaxID=88688 RepID=A0A2W5X4S7_9CAUL|nr:hypothetical protein [Caulobacter segnis]PZR35784.1 MAG: hypothetical protein DI526_05710 [Caulobacter segnis]